MSHTRCVSRVVHIQNPHDTQVTLVSATGLRKLGAEPSSLVRLRILNSNPKVRL